MKQKQKKNIYINIHILYILREKQKLRENIRCVYTFKKQ